MGDEEGTEGTRRGRQVDHAPARQVASADVEPGKPMGPLEPWAGWRAAVRAGRSAAHPAKDVLRRAPVPVEEEGAMPDGMSCTERARRGNLGSVRSAYSRRVTEDTKESAHDATGEDAPRSTQHHPVKADGPSPQADGSVEDRTGARR